MIDNINEEIIKELNKKQPHDLQTEIDIFKKAIQRRCEFYLRYKDNPELFVDENHEYEKKVISFKDKYKLFFRQKELDKYNEWLFKLAFKGVIDE